MAMLTDCIYKGEQHEHMLNCGRKASGPVTFIATITQRRSSGLLPPQVDSFSRKDWNI